MKESLCSASQNMEDYHEIERNSLPPNKNLSPEPVKIDLREQGKECYGSVGKKTKKGKSRLISMLFDEKEESKKSCDSPYTNFDISPRKDSGNTYCSGDEGFTSTTSLYKPAAKSQFSQCLNLHEKVDRWLEERGISFADTKDCDMKYFQEKSITIHRRLSHLKTVGALDTPSHHNNQQFDSTAFAEIAVSTKDLGGCEHFPKENEESVRDFQCDLESVKELKVEPDFFQLNLKSSPLLRRRFSSNMSPELLSQKSIPVDNEERPLIFMLETCSTDK